MVVSTHFQTNVARRGKIIAISTQYASTSALYFSTSFDIGDVIPGFIYATGHTYINFPLETGVKDVAFLIIYDGPSTIASTDRYAAISVQLRPSTAGGFTGSLYDSTVEAAFERFYSTAAFVASSTEAQAFIFGPIDTYRYACNYGGTSTGDVDKYQNFIRMMVGHSTASAGCTHDALSTNAPANGVYICPIQFGSTRLGT
jgi:hypothetical protein